MAEFHRRHESHADQSVMTSSLARSRIMTSGGRVKQRALQPFRRARECAPLRMQNASVMRRCERGGRLDDTSRQRSYPDRLWSARHDQRWDSRMIMSRDCGFRKAQGRASIAAHRGSAWLAHGLDIGAGRSTSVGRRRLASKVFAALSGWTEPWWLARRAVCPPRQIAQEREVT